MQKKTIRQQYLELKAANDKAEAEYKREEIMKNVIYSMIRKNGITLGQFLDLCKGRN